MRSEALRNSAQFVYSEQVFYSSEHVRQAWADVVIFPATGDFLKFILPDTRPESQTW